MIKITGIKKAVGDYQRANAGGAYSPRYGVMMLDRTTGKVWTDEFYSIGHNSWKDYHDQAIVDVASVGHYLTQAWRTGEGVVLSMKNVKAWATKACKDYAAGIDYKQDMAF